MVKGISRQVIVVRSPDPKLFEQAIFILREDALGKDGMSDPGHSAPGSAGGRQLCACWKAAGAASGEGAVGSRRRAGYGLGLAADCDFVSSNSEKGVGAHGALLHRPYFLKRMNRCYLIPMRVCEAAPYIRVHPETSRFPGVHPYPCS